MTGATPARLRVGLLCRGTTLPAWQARAVRELLAVPGVTICLLVVDPRRSERPAGRRLRGDPHLLWRAYNNRWVARRSSALAPVDMSAELADAAVLRARPERQGRWSEHFTPDDLATIREHQPDVLLRFAYGIIRGEILDVAPHGVWSFHHGDIERYRGGPPAFWELMRDDDVTGAVLQRLTDRLDGGIVLRQGWFSTVHHSYVRNADRVRWGGAHWPAQVCRDVLEGRTDEVQGAPTPSDAPVDHNPTTAQMLRFGSRQVRGWLTHQVRSLTRTDRWRIGVIDAPIDEVLRDPAVEPRWLPVDVSRSEYLADPFPDPATGDVLAERFSYRTRTGHLVRIADGARRDVRIATGLDRHLSYPYIIEHDGTTYCLPQVAGSTGVRMFRLAGAALEAGTTLVPDVAALDPTVVHHDGRWWLFFTDGSQGSMSHLHVWHADDLTGPWTPHHGNPVKVDVRSSRPAGTPFVVDGVLYRPAQDCSATYGGAIALNRVDLLTPDRFRESCVAMVRPQPSWDGAKGCHTLAAAGDVTLVDAKWHVFSPPAALGEVRARLGLVGRGGHR